jgi:GNAT superfamily N-acetyltransferase
MAKGPKFLPMRPEQARTASDLIARVFRVFVAPLFTAEGQREFLAYTGPERMAARLGRNHRALVAVAGRRIVGIIEVRGRSHVSLLFVEGAHQRRGVARGLFRAAFEDAGGARRRITVNASPNSVAAYERLGFCAKGPERARKGIRFLPMVFRGVMLHGEGFG